MHFYHCLNLLNIASLVFNRILWYTDVSETPVYHKKFIQPAVENPPPQEESMNISETIARLRKEKNVTQEAVAQAVGVSTQAVSKWENGGLPDVELLPAIADYFGVSVDMLFGREISAGNLEEAITRRFASMPEEDRMELAFQLAWVMERALFRPDAKDHDIAAIRAAHKCGTQQYSRITLDSGFTQMGLAPLSYFLLVPENEDFKAKLTDGVDFSELFADLAMPDVLDAFLLLYARPTDKFFTAGLLEKTLGMTAERSEEVMRILSKYGQLWEQELELDDQVMKTYLFSPHPAFPALLIFAREILKKPDYFFYHMGGRQKPYF